MKLAASIVISALCWTARSAAAATAQVYTFDSALQPKDEVKSRSLSPTEARLVLAQRAGVEDYHEADLLESIDAINEFGLRARFFGGGEEKRIFMLVEGVDDDAQVVALKSTSHFAISPSPSFESTWALFLDLARQRAPERCSRLSDADLIPLLRTDRPGHDPISAIADFAIIPAAHLPEFWNLILQRSQNMGEQWSLTALISPPSTTAGDKTIFGSYSMPQSHSQSHLHLKRQQQESPLTPLQQSNQSSPLKGILPACYPSLSSCQSTTLNCTGHGTCRLAYTDKSHPEGDARPCYSCSCSPTVSENSEGQKKTTYWGGPACQKKDVSVQFWLIALFSVGLVGMIGFAVGSLWGMGEETLPSVIGAGVSGVGARR